MKILIRNHNGAREQSVDLSSAVETAMEGYIDTERGTLERIRDEMQNHRRFIGELVAKLVETGKIDAETIEYLLGGDFRVVPSHTAPREIIGEEREDWLKANGYKT